MRKTAVSLASERGLRPYQEDSYGIFMIGEWECFAIADGFNPSNSDLPPLSRDVISHLLQSASELLERDPILTNETYQRYFNSLFEMIDLQTKEFVTGSTLAVTFHSRRNHDFFTACLGDSVVAHLTQDDVRINPLKNLDLGFSELWGAFGDALNADHHLKDPECHHFEVTQGDAVLLASDGLFSGHGQIVLADLKEYRQQVLEEKHGAHYLVDKAHREKQSDDNATAIVIRVLD